MFNILIVEDENDIREMIIEALNQPDYNIYTAKDGQEALEVFKNHSQFDLLILDLMLPRMDGLTVLQKIRQSSIVPVLIVSARNGEYEKVLGLEYGADDYLTKPFSVIELKARAKALLRRVNEYKRKDDNQETILYFGKLTIELENHVVKREGNAINLTAKEYDMLKLFALHPQKVYTKVQLYKEIWDDEFLNDENVINVTVRRLREKIEQNPSDPQYIKTVWGIGYKSGAEGDMI